ncbi:MAG TPA: YggS family pyridoxal phosphate-dependent enzyme [Thermoanaerobaculia bacterium]|nr:YggS family pyridoxal phosphate-dependent enzyme [Thermoanaerobaculia bacterium]
MTRGEEIADGLARVKSRIEAAARRAGRDPESITLVGISKTKPVEDLRFAFAAGLRAFGENRVQEAEEKFQQLPAGVERHLVGPIQSNKANRAARVADVVQSVDSDDLVRRLDRAAEALGKRLAVFLEVNIGGEATKAGVSPGDVSAIVASVRATKALDLRGLMAIPPPGDTRPFFRRLRELATAHRLPELSMGMSDDFEVAIEEGATLVRIGTAIFGSRA